MIRIRRRQRLRRKETAAYSRDILEGLGVDPFPDREDIDVAEAGEWKLLIVDGEVRGVLLGDRAFLTIRGLLAYPAKRAHVTVDMGAVKFVYNGADVMAPGVVDADPAIRPADPVWVRDERNLRPLAIGEALMSGPDMVASERGKAVRSLHHVGDPIWKLDEEPAE